MSLKYIPAGAALMAVLLTAACSSDTDVTATSADTAVVATDTYVPQTANVETAPPAVETMAPASTPVPVATAPQQAEQVPSVMRRTSEAPAQQVSATFPPRVSVVQLREMLDEGTAVVVDSRDRVSYAIEHIPGSINIPAQESTMRAGELPKGKTIVTYCA